MSNDIFCALPSHTDFDAGAVMEIIFVLFSVTPLPLTHVVSFFLEHISTLTTFPSAQLCIPSGGGDKQEGSKLHLRESGFSEQPEQ